MINYAPLPAGFEIKDMLAGEHNCPTCSQQTYLRPIDLSAVLVYALRIIVDRSVSGAITTGNDMAAHGRTVYCNYTQLKYWGFIIEDRSAGGWRATIEATEFLEKMRTVPPRLWVFADRVRMMPDEYPFNVGHIGIDAVKPYHPKSRQEARERMIGLEAE